LVFSNFSLKSNDDNTILKETLSFHQRSENICFVIVAILKQHHEF